MNNSVICTGTTISDTIILTAAHCVEDITDAKTITAVFHTSISCESGFDLNSQANKASALVIHKGYSKTSFAVDDLALVKLSAPIPASYHSSDIYDEKIPLSSDLTATTQTNIQFDQSDSRGICNGDSGGPVFVESQGELKIIGVNSIVSGEKDSFCHGRSKAMYTPGYAKWIQDNMQSLK